MNYVDPPTIPEGMTVMEYRKLRRITRTDRALVRFYLWLVR